MQSFSKTEKTIIAVAALILILSSGLVFFGGLDRIQELAMGREAIGRIEKPQNDVRHKSDKELNWIQTENSTQVYEMDSVFTGDNSTAEVHLIDGSQIGIDPNSLVIISLNKNQANVELQYGNLWSEIKPNTTLRVTAGNKKYELKSDNAKQRVRLIQPKSGELKVEVSEGAVALKEEKKPLRVIEPPKPEVVLAPEPVVEAPPKVIQPPQFTTPENQQTFSFEFPEDTPATQALKSIDVRWSTSEPLEKYEWQLAKDANFKDILQKSQTILTELQTAELSKGVYWMRVRGALSSEKTTEWSQPLQVTMNLKIQAPQKPLAPVLVNKDISFSRSTFSSREPASVPKDKVINWKPVPKAEKYKVEMSEDLQFSDPQVIETKNTELILLPDDPGSYYYRVFAIKADKQSDASSVGSIQVQPSQIAIEKLVEFEKVGDTPKPADATIEWTSVPGASSYTLEVAKDSSFSNSKKLKFNSNSGSVLLPKPGKYSVRVQALNSKQMPISEVSDVQSVLYKYRPSLKAPKSREPFPESSLFIQNQTSAAIWLEWESVLGASSYEIEVSNKEDFSSLIFKEVSTSTRLFVSKTLPLGKIFWRIRALSPNQENASSDWSTRNVFTLYHQKNESLVK